MLYANIHWFSIHGLCFHYLVRYPAQWGWDIICNFHPWLREVSIHGLVKRFPPMASVERIALPALGDIYPWPWKTIFHGSESSMDWVGHGRRCNYPQLEHHLFSGVATFVMSLKKSLIGTLQKKLTSRYVVAALVVSWPESSTLVSLLLLRLLRVKVTWSDLPTPKIANLQIFARKSLKLLHYLLACLWHTLCKIVQGHACYITKEKTWCWTPHLMTCSSTRAVNFKGTNR